MRWTTQVHSQFIALQRSTPPRLPVGASLRRAPDVLPEYTARSAERDNLLRRMLHHVKPAEKIDCSQVCCVQHSKLTAKGLPAKCERLKNNDLQTHRKRLDKAKCSKIQICTSV
jgi:hypothetical protein